MSKRVKEIEERQELKKWRRGIEKIQQQIDNDTLLVDEMLKKYPG